MTIELTLKRRHLTGKAKGLKGDKLNRYVQDYVQEQIADMHVLSPERAAWLKEGRKYTGNSTIHNKDEYSHGLTNLCTVFGKVIKIINKSM